MCRLDGETAQGRYGRRYERDRDIMVVPSENVSRLTLYHTQQRLSIDSMCVIMVEIGERNEGV